MIGTQALDIGWKPGGTFKCGLKPGGVFVISQLLFWKFAVCRTFCSMTVLLKPGGTSKELACLETKGWMLSNPGGGNTLFFVFFSALNPGGGAIFFEFVFS